MFWGLLAAAVFAWLGGMLGMVGWRASKGQIPYRSPIGLRGQRVEATARAWDRGHRAAAPLVLTAAAICLLQTAACAWAALSSDLRGGPYLAILVVTGATLVALLLFLANAVGNKSTR